MEEKHVRIDPESTDRIRRKHPLQYGYRGRDIVYDPGDDPTVGERYNRCPNCEQWSPCDVRALLEAAFHEKRNLKDLFADALTIDGWHHKQWYIWRIAEMLGVDVSDIDAYEGIAP